jgi:asparagine synthase (glutamine-hydrolysing)
VRQAQELQEYGLPADLAAAWRRGIAGSEPLHAISVLELSSFIGQRLLRDTDAASMAVALEVRVPLLDHALIEAVAGVDPARRFFPSRKKQLLRDIALDGLDPAIFDRPKSGFVLPIDTWARSRLQPQMEALFSDPEAARRVGLDSDSLRTLWRSFVDGRPGLYWSRIWALYVLLSWCQIHEISLRR